MNWLVWVICGASCISEGIGKCGLNVPGQLTELASGTLCLEDLTFARFDDLRQLPVSFHVAVVEDERAVGDEAMPIPEVGYPGADVANGDGVTRWFPGVAKRRRSGCSSCCLVLIPMSAVS